MPRIWEERCYLLSADFPWLFRYTEWCVMRCRRIHADGRDLGQGERLQTLSLTSSLVGEYKSGEHAKLSPRVHLSNRSTSSSVGKEQEMLRELRIL